MTNRRYIRRWSPTKTSSLEIKQICRRLVRRPWLSQRIPGECESIWRILPPSKGKKSRRSTWNSSKGKRSSTKSRPISRILTTFPHPRNRNLTSRCSRNSTKRSSDISQNHPSDKNTSMIFRRRRTSMNWGKRTWKRLRSTLPCFPKMTNCVEIKSRNK